MKITNILLSILILLLAAASAVFSYFLFEKRSQFVAGWGKMAKAINETAVVLDQDSGIESVAEKLSVSAISHEQFASLDQKLPLLAQRSRQIINVRDNLADALRRIGVRVGAKVPDEKVMRGIESHENGRNVIVTAVQDTVFKRDRMFNYVSSLAQRQFNARLDVNKMKNGDGTALQPLEKNINAVNSRKRAYESSLSNIGKMVEVKRFDSSDNGFSKSAKSVEQGVRALQSRCNDTQRKLDAANRKIQAHEKTIASRVKEIAMQRSVIAEKDRQIKSYKRALGRPNDEAVVAPWGEGSVEARSHLVGKVIEVHDKYGYIAIDIGKGSTVVQEIGNRKLEVNAGVKKGLDFIVARGSLRSASDFVARVVIDEVGEFCSTANISPNSKQIKVGDIVYWTPEK